MMTLAVGLRAMDLGRAPRPMETADELHYVWCGLSLMTQGRPTAWSMLAGYQGTPAWLGRAGLGDASFPIVRPALDHPPLYSLLAGGFAWLTGAKPVSKLTDLGRPVTLWAVDFNRCRALSLILYAASFLLLYDLAARRCGWVVALLTLLLYGSLSHIVLHGRLLVTETLTTPLFLGGLCAWERYRLGRWSERRFAVVTILLVAAALLSKLVAVSQAAAVFFLLLLDGRRRAAIYPVLGAALGGALYAAYGAWQGWDFFVEILRTQAARFHGFGVLEGAIKNPRLVHESAFSYPLLLGWGAVFAGALGGASRRGRPLLAAAIVYLLAFTYFASVPAMYGWHWMPFYPFMALGIAIVFREAYRRPKPIVYLATIGLLAPMAFDALFQEHVGWAKPLRLAYLAATAGILCLPFLPPTRARPLQRLTLTLALATLLLRELWTVWFAALN
jgi:hypothetical protein